jgi:hypothetical protein
VRKREGKIRGVREREGEGRESESTREREGEREGKKGKRADPSEDKHEDAETVPTGAGSLADAQSRRDATAELKKNPSGRGERKLTGENEKVSRPKFSTLS